MTLELEHGRVWIIVSQSRRCWQVPIGCWRWMDPWRSFFSERGASGGFVSDHTSPFLALSRQQHLRPRHHQTINRSRAIFCLRHRPSSHSFGACKGLWGRDCPLERSEGIGCDQPVCYKYDGGSHRERGKSAPWQEKEAAWARILRKHRKSETRPCPHGRAVRVRMSLLASVEKGSMAWAC